MSPTKLKCHLSEWSFSESRLATLPMDPEQRNVVRGHVPKSIFSAVKPTPFQTPPKLVAVR
jgi:hypothetical protein